MTSLSQLRFYSTPGHACSYLEGREATTLYLDPKIEVDQGLYSRLSALGFRRSGAHFYQPDCQNCKACVAVRLPASSFQPKRIQQRIWRRNQDLQVTWSTPRYCDEFYDLYCRYISGRHAEGDMYPPHVDQFSTFLVEGGLERHYCEIRLEGKLVSLAVVDRLQDGLSAVYTFFDPDESRRSLGVHAVLCTIEQCRQLGLDYVYLGYWIKQSRKMNYKLNYRPTEIFLYGHWLPVQ